MKKSVKKVLRYIFIYGILRTLAKVIGRLRPKFKFWLILGFPWYSNKGKRVGLIGCGHHAFSSIAFYLTSSTDCKITFALDVDDKASSSLAFAFNSVDMQDRYIPDNNDIELPDIVYISSNHSTHTEYAIEYLNYGCDVFIEKPISINIKQLDSLANAVNLSNQNVYVGYNRPHSPSMNLIKEFTNDKELPFTLSCFVSGHLIPEDHWYRDPTEGTRIVANLGHWIDLATHILFWSQNPPDHLNVAISYSDLSTPSDNIVVSIVSSNHDLINMTFTSRSEPFEGVNETINFQQGDLIAKIDDFRSTKIWKNDFYKKYYHWPKNNGHKATVMQPFGSALKREWKEIEWSSRLMLHIEDMVISGATHSTFRLSK
ncbi:Gfo/Idh/MocA family oxidoreductase [Candidatus Pseudothioglobus singularis]|nr:Gfo/Idh/MocA family oxidoreductase [Candidatus Pseudothioglobus singularis]